jgi:hypothetical protein|tara:strand:- start:252 stop:557 length:306 start_codon:yes stop_codon:yes gene_type:complete
MSDFEEFIKEMQKKGTIVAGVDACMCAKCVARRKKFGAKAPEIIPAESDDPIQEENRKRAIKRLEVGLQRNKGDNMGFVNFKTKQTQRKTKQRKNKKKKEK